MMRQDNKICDFTNFSQKKNSGTCFWHAPLFDPREHPASHAMATLTLIKLLEALLPVAAPHFSLRL